MNQSINELLENNSLRKEFELRNLDLSQVFIPTPDDLERENRFLKHFLDWVQKYSELGSRKKMEEEGYEFPPIEPGISPENDWYVFEQWVNGISIRKKIKELLPKNYILKNPEQLNDEEILNEVKKLTKFLEESNISVGLVNELPIRLLYTYLLETMEEEHEMLIDGVWTFDGCSGYCPACFQRPWCETGGKFCWHEDEEAGEMFLADSVKKYVSASPVSLQILQKFQAEEDEKFKKFEMRQNESNISFNPDYDNLENFNSDNDDEIPF